MELQEMIAAAQPAFEQLVMEAKQHHEDDVLPRLEREVRYYNGASDVPISGRYRDADTGDIKETGEKVVITECRDTADQLLVEISRALLLERDLVRFRARDFRSHEEAEQAQAYVRAQFFDENNGVDLLEEMLQAWTQSFLVLLTVWDEEVEIKTTTARGLLEDQVQLLGSTEGVEIVEVIEAPVIFQGQPIPAFDVTFERREMCGRHRIEVIPPEELLIDPWCSKPENATLIGQRCRRMVTDLVSEGLDFETVKQFAETGDDQGTRRDQINRARRGEGAHLKASQISDDSLHWVEAFHGWTRLDLDGDGIAEWYHVIALGHEPEIVAIEPSDRPGIILSSAKRIQNAPLGNSVVQETMDLQDWATGLIRADMDNLREAVKAQVKVASQDTTAYSDVANGRRIIRTDDPTQNVQNFVTPYVGQYARSMLQEVENRRTKRTGISDAGAGLSADMLKGQTVEGAQAIVSAPQKRADFYARAFVNRAMLPLFKEIYRQAIENATAERMIEMRGDLVPVDPRSWKIDARLSVELNTGTSMQPEIIQASQMAIGMATQVYQALGPKAPAYIGDAEISNMLDDFYSALGVGDVRRYVKRVDDQVPVQPQPTEEDKQRAHDAQIEQMKLQANLAAARMKAMTELVKLGTAQKADLDKAAMQAEVAIEREELDVEAARAS